MRLLSGRVGVTSYSGLSTERKQTDGFPSFLGMEEVEPNLGLPGNNNHVLYGSVDGTRYWGAPSGAPSGSVEGIDVQKDAITPVGFGGSTTIINFTGNGVDVFATKQDNGGVEVGVATVRINRSPNDIQDANEFTRVTGITTFRVGTGLSFMPVPGTTGIVSIFTTGATIAVQNGDGSSAVQNVNVVRVGKGLTASQVSVGIATIDVSGDFDNIRAAGIITADQYYSGNVVGTALTASIFDGGTFTGNLLGDVTGNLLGITTGTHNGDVLGNIVGDLNSTGVSTISYLQNINVNSSGIITATNFDGDLAGAVTGSLTGNVTGDVTGNLTGNVTGNVTSSGSNTFNQVLVSGVTTSTGGFVGDVTGDVTGNVVGNLNGNINATSGINTITNQLKIFVDDGSPARVDYYCEVSNAHYTRVQSAPHSEYSGNVELTLGTKSGDFIIGDTAGAITQNIHTTGIITAANFHGDGANISNIVANSSTLTATNTTNSTHYLIFAAAATGSEPFRTDVDLNYNPATNTLTATKFAGNATGLVDDPTISVAGITLKGNMIADADATRNLGASGTRWANVYTADMHFSNVGTGGNDVDGTEGNWTLQEGENDIFMINNKTGKRFKIALTPVD